MKTTFKRINNGYHCNCSYEASNGLEIIHNEKSDNDFHGYNYTVWNGSARLAEFDLLKQAKEFCSDFGELKPFKKWLANNKAERATFKCRIHRNGEAEFSVYFIGEDIDHVFSTEQEARTLLKSRGFLQ